jgi:Transmembrane secretion effector
VGAPVEPGEGPTRRALRRVAIDITPLRVSRDYRLLWSGLFVSELGYQLARVAIYIQVYALTGSPAAVGLIGIVGLAALVLGTLVGGSIIDAHDRRRTLRWAQVAFSASAAMLFAGALAGRPPVGLLYAATAITAFASAFDGPARSAMTPRLVGEELLPSALAVNQVLWQTVQIAGPALAGIVIHLFGLAPAYAFDLATYGVLFAAASAMRPMPPEHDAAGASGWGAVREGFGFVRRNRLISSTFAIDLVAMIFGMPQALFPVLAVTQFHRGPVVVGLLFAAPPVGALVQVLAGGWVGRVRRRGLAVIWAVVGWGAAIAAFGLVGRHLGLALAFLAIAGAADVISAIFRSTILQLSVPDRLRGRLSGIHILVVTGGPRLGDFESGIVAQAFTPTASVVSGGLACIVGAAIVAFAYPELWGYRADAGRR